MTVFVTNGKTICLCNTISLWIFQMSSSCMNNTFIYWVAFASTLVVIIENPSVFTCRPNAMRKSISSFWIKVIITQLICGHTTYDRVMTAYNYNIPMCLSLCGNISLFHGYYKICAFYVRFCGMAIISWIFLLCLDMWKRLVQNKYLVKLYTISIFEPVQ